VLWAKVVTPAGKAPSVIAATLHWLNQSAGQLTEREVTSSRAVVAELFGAHGETGRGIEEQVRQFRWLHLPSSYHRDYPRTLATVNARVLGQLIETSSHWKPRVVVIGDAQRLVAPLRQSTAVEIVDPVRGFVTVKSLASLN